MKKLLLCVGMVLAVQAMPLQADAAAAGGELTPEQMMQQVQQTMANEEFQRALARVFEQGGQEAEVAQFFKEQMPFLSDDLADHFAKAEVARLRPDADLSPEQQDLFDAVSEGKEDAVRELLQQGVDPNFTFEGDYLLWYSMNISNNAIFEMLLDKATPEIINARDTMGHTPLHFVAMAGNLSWVQQLIAKGADVDAVDPIEGATPLMMAAGLGKPGMVYYLLEQGADPTLKSKDGHTAADIAQARGHDEIVEILKQSQAVKPARKR